MRVMLICGSLHRASGTRAALRLAAEALESLGAEVDFYDLGEHRFPLYDPDAAAPAEVVEFRTRAMAADAFILGSPEYHSGMSGALKNALDFHRQQVCEAKARRAAVLCRRGERRHQRVEQHADRGAGDTRSGAAGAGCGR